jgi:hypothetical protein
MRPKKIYIPDFAYARNHLATYIYRRISRCFLLCGLFGKSLVNVLNNLGCLSFSNAYLIN